MDSPISFENRPVMSYSSSSSNKQQSSNPFLLTPYRPDRDCHPPPLISRRIIPLPALTECPIILNPLLAYTANTPPITFDLSVSASAATLSPINGVHSSTGREFWRQEPAMQPANVGSITIRPAGAEAFAQWRPIVVFPKSVYDSVVTIDDVLETVSRSLRAAILKRQGHIDSYNRYDNQRTFQASMMPSSLRSSRGVCDMICWGGLCPSPEERDVWILHIRMHSTHRQM